MAKVIEKSAVVSPVVETKIDQSKLIDGIRDAVRAAAKTGNLADVVSAFLASREDAKTKGLETSGLLFSPVGENVEQWPQRSVLHESWQGRSKTGIRVYQCTVPHFPALSRVSTYFSGRDATLVSGLTLLWWSAKDASDLRYLAAYFSKDVEFAACLRSGGPVNDSGNGGGSWIFSELAPLAHKFGKANPDLRLSLVGSYVPDFQTKTYGGGVTSVSKESRPATLAE